jgi:hypothetical protein
VVVVYVPREVAKCEADGLALGCHQSPDDVSLSREIPHL